MLIAHGISRRVNVVIDRALSTLDCTQLPHCMFDNAGATDAVELFLPGVAVGGRVGFYVAENEEFEIHAYGDHTIRHGSSITSAGGSISAATVGHFVVLYGLSDTEWVVEHMTGEWSVS